MICPNYDRHMKFPRAVGGDAFPAAKCRKEPKEMVDQPCRTTAR
jgi:hypothetical protein